MQQGIVLRDGESQARAVAEVDLASPMWVGGQSLFETLLVWPMQTRHLYLEVRHLQRLQSAARRLMWPGVPAPEQMHGWMLRAAALFGARFRGYGRMRVTVAWTRPGMEPVTFVTVVPYTRPSQPLTAVITDVVVPGLGSVAVPKSGNRLAYALAETKAGPGADEAILTDAAGRAVEGAKSNLFGVMDRVIRTPAVADGALGGIVRGRVLELALHMGLHVEEAPFDQGYLAAADGFFMTNALWGVRAVKQLDRRALRVDVPAICALQSAYAADVRAVLESGTGLTKLL